MGLDFEEMEKELAREADPERDAWERGEYVRHSDKGLTVLWTGFEEMTTAEHAQEMVGAAVRHSNRMGAGAPKIPSVNLAHTPFNCGYKNCKTMKWAIVGQQRPFCDEHDTPEIREEYGYD